MTTLDERIAALEALDEARTPGAWRYSDNGHVEASETEDRLPMRFSCGGNGNKLDARKNARFAAAAPEMMSVIRELKAERDAALEVIVEYRMVASALDDWMVRDRRKVVELLAERDALKAEHKKLALRLTDLYIEGLEKP